ncbi:MAG: hypothetical protein L0Y74_00025 [candidate division Zixibacteria bacterium]|nr:hypothetical protein [candidate division Zixibacteria bacterium]
MGEAIKLLVVAGFGGFAVIFYLLINPDKFERWMAIVYKGFYFLSSNIPRIKRKVDRLVVATSIQDSVNGICDQVDKQAPGALPHALKIEWVQSESPESFIKEGKVIVRLKHYENQDKNIVNSTLMYLKVGLLPRSRSYLDKSLRKSCEFKLATQVFSTKRETGAYDYFFEKELGPAIAEDLNLKRDLQLLEDIDAVGYFTRVFLIEVKEVGQKLLGTVPTPAVQQELRNFAKFLQTIANKAVSENVPLAFNGQKVKTAVVLVAKKEKIDLYGIDPYVAMISKLAREGYESIYVSGWGEEYVKKVIEIKNTIQENLVKVIRRYEHSVRGSIKGVLLVCQSNLVHLARQKEIQEEVKNAMMKTVPEIQSGKIEIVSIARIKGVGCKIAVRSTSDGDNTNAMGACIGEKGERHDALRAYFPNEFIGIVPWSEDASEFVVSALTPLKLHQVDTVEIDEENLIATVRVLTDEAYTKALGRDRSNIKCASELTGWVIRIEGPTRSAIAVQPDEELRKKLIQCVPQLRNNDIEIVRIARIKGVGSRVIVKWRDERVPRRFLASQVCIGQDMEYLKAVQQEFLREWIYFHEWADDPVRQIKICLHPLRESDIESVELNNESNTAIIRLKKVLESPPLWRGQYNLALAERVTGWRINIQS